MATTGFAEELDAARSRTDELFNLLAPGALYQRPVPERHRLVFYLGHLEAFDWNLICRTALQLPSFHPTFDKLFAFGIDPGPDRLPSDQASDWPSCDEVRRYNTRVRDTLSEVLQDAPAQVIATAIEHRLMHAETLAYLLHNLPFEQKHGPAPAVLETEPPKPQMIEITAGAATLGQDRAQFGWDNEFDEHRVDVAPFAIARYKVTNGEYLGFVQEGAAAPHFWTVRDGAWWYRGMFGMIPLPLHWPVFVTHNEAAAYAAWAGKSLPTEAQFHRAAFGAPAAAERPFAWIGETDQQAPGNVDFRRWDPVAVNGTPQADTAFGVAQMTGNGWEWTSTVFRPFPGFQPFSFYPGYSRDFFDGNHYVLKGASPRTAARFLRRSFRNWFRPDYPYAYATFHLVEN